jgi:hypothetical protein
VNVILFEFSTFGGSIDERRGIKRGDGWFLTIPSRTQLGEEDEIKREEFFSCPSPPFKLSLFNSLFKQRILCLNEEYLIDSAVLFSNIPSIIFTLPPSVFLSSLFIINNREEEEEEK